MQDETTLQRNLQFGKIFRPYAARQAAKLYENQHGPNGFAERKPVVLAHYTTAEAALSILSEKRIWLRNATSMVDYREIRHGYDLLNSYFSDDARRKTFTSALDLSHPGAADSAFAFFHEWWHKNQNLNVYVASISEHDVSENYFGRLSMWRAFNSGSSALAALVFKLPFYSGSAEALGIDFSPVAYLGEKDLGQVMLEIADNFKSEKSFLKEGMFDEARNQLLFSLKMAVTCMKHEGFMEEREWRAVYMPGHRAPNIMPDAVLKTFRGVPQHIYELPLDKEFNAALTGIDLIDNLERIIIGPTQYAWVLYKAFVEKLKLKGIQDAPNRVIVSDIPIRS